MFWIETEKNTPQTLRPFPNAPNSRCSEWISMLWCVFIDSKWFLNGCLNCILIWVLLSCISCSKHYHLPFCTSLVPVVVVFFQLSSTVYISLDAHACRRTTSEHIKLMDTKLNILCEIKQRRQWHFWSQSICILRNAQCAHEMNCT